MKSIKFVLFFFLSSFTLISHVVASLENENRVNDLENFRNDGICLGRFEPDVCEKYRKKAINKGYINQEEYETLKENRAYPIIDYSLKSSNKDAFSNWCLCKLYREDF